MSEEQQDIRRISVSQTAMKLGLWLGLYQTVKLAFIPLAAKWAIAGVILPLLAIGVPFVAYRLVRKFRDENTAEFFPFFSAWLITILTFLFATMISGIIAYIYLKYLDGGGIREFLLTRLGEMQTALSEMKTEAGMEEMLAMANQTMELYQSMSPLTAAKMLISNSMFFGNLFSVIIALVTARVKRLNSL